MTKYHILGTLAHRDHITGKIAELTVNVIVDADHAERAKNNAKHTRCNLSGVQPSAAWWDSEPTVEVLGDQMLPGFDEGA